MIGCRVSDTMIDSYPLPYTVTDEPSTELSCNDDGLMVSDLASLNGKIESDAPVSTKK